MPDRLLYPGAKIEVFKEGQSNDAHIVLSEPKRLSNTLRLEKEKWVSGFQQKWLVRLDRSVDNLDVMRFYEKEIAARGELLFKCEGRACGTSSDWANKLLNQSVLTGRDSNQYYVAGRYRHNDVPGWLSVYVVKNGRRQNYAFVQYVSENQAGQFGPKEVVYLQLDDLDQGQKDRIKKLYTSGVYILVGLQQSHSGELDLAQWNSRSELMQQWLEEYLDSLVPGWRQRSQLLRVPPMQAMPPGIDSDAWFSFVSIKP